MASNAEALARGMQLLQSGRLGEAERAFLAVLARDKENNRVHFALGVTCYQQDRFADAERYLSESIARSPDFLPAYNNLALVRKAMGEPQRGVEVLQRALALAPAYVDARYNLALIFEETGERRRAVDLYREVIAQAPEFLRAHTNLGLLLRADGDYATALQHLEFVATRTPQDVDALVNVELTLTDLARYADAVRIGKRATALEPDSTSAWEALGNAQRLAADTDSAIVSLERAHRLRPGSVELQFELALAQNASGDLDAARKTLNTVTALRPDWLKALFARELALPPFYASNEQITDCRAAFAAGLEVIESRILGSSDWSPDEGVGAIAGFAPFYLQYQGLDNTELLRRFGRILTTIAKRAWPKFAVPVAWQARAQGGRLRVGFVSAYLRRHSVGHYFGNWICQLNAERFESFVWYTGEARDDVSERIAGKAGHYWHTTFDTAALASAIVASELDVLIHLDVGMHPQSQLLAALRLAPVQCATFGHPATSGLEAIDYFLSASAAEPPEAQQHYTERLIQLPRFAVSYARPNVSQRRAPSALKPGAGPLVFCAQPLFKLLPDFDRMVARIVRDLPGCRLAFIETMWTRVNAAFVMRMSAALREVGVDPATTLQMMPIMPYEEYLGTLAAANVVLDSTGFSGGNSSFDAIAVGVPLVTQRGSMLRGRQTAAMLDIVGLPELAPMSADDYVTKAIELASDANVRADVVARMSRGSGALFDDVNAVRALEQVLLQLTA
ncbi:MAG: tetratricopeptide repeat protein [Usitatibacteraceae bacterium]